MDCIYETLSAKMPNITIKDIFACNGIANTIISFRYAEEWFDIIDGRGMGNPIEIIEGMNIPYTMYSVDDFWNYESKEYFLIFASKDLFIQYKKLKSGYKQLLFFYSCFFVEKEFGKNITLKIVRDDAEYVIKKEELEQISRISTFPLERPIYIVKIEDIYYKMDISYVKKSLLEKVDLFLGNSVEKEEFRIKITGKNMYDEFAKRIKMKKHEKAWKNIDVMKQNFLIASLNAGSIGLYRREFADSIEGIFGLKLKNISDKFRRSANAWCEIGRKLSYFQNNNKKISDEVINYLLPIIDDIKELELSAMRELKRNLIGEKNL